MADRLISHFTGRSCIQGLNHRGPPSHRAYTEMWRYVLEQNGLEFPPPEGVVTKDYVLGFLDYTFGKYVYSLVESNMHNITAFVQNVLGQVQVAVPGPITLENIYHHTVEQPFFPVLA